MSQGKQRIELMDAMRGLALCLMVIHHFLYDLCAFCGVPWVWFTNPVFDALHYFFAGLFILLSGVSSNFSRSNVKRGLKALAVSLGITAVTYFMDMPILFGVLHLLASCMLLYGLTQGFWQRLNAAAPWVTPAISVLGVLATARLVRGRPTDVPHLWMFGFTTPGFYSSDYFPLLPWMFVFLLGTWAGKYIREGRLPRWFYETRAPHLAAVGRHSLLIYVAHQPVLYALTMLGLWIFGRG